MMIGLVFNHLQALGLASQVKVSLPRIHLYSNNGVSNVSRTLNNTRLIKVWKVTDASIGETTLREIHLDITN
jgi:hypothetical protein